MKLADISNHSYCKEHTSSKLVGAHLRLFNVKLSIGNVYIVSMPQRFTYLMILEAIAIIDFKPIINKKGENRYHLYVGV